MSGSTSNLHYSSTSNTNLSNNNFTTNDEDYHDYMNAEAINQHHQQIYQNMNYSSQMDNNNHQIYANHPPSGIQKAHHSSCGSIGAPAVSGTDASYHVPPTNQLQGITIPPSQSPPQSSPPVPATVGGESQSQQNLVSVSGKKKCSHCGEELGRGAAMIIESLRLFYHIPCFVCCVCGVQLGNGEAGADVRVRNHALHCQNCYSNDKGKFFFVFFFGGGVRERDLIYMTAISDYFLKSWKEYRALFDLCQNNSVLLSSNCLPYFLSV